MSLLYLVAGLGLIPVHNEICVGHLQAAIACGLHACWKPLTLAAVAVVLGGHVLATSGAESCSCQQRIIVLQHRNSHVLLLPLLLCQCCIQG